MRFSLATAGGLVSLFCSNAALVFGDTPQNDGGRYESGKTSSPPESAPENALSLIAEPMISFSVSTGTFFPILLSNRTSASISLPSCDEFLFIVEEALDQHGKWKPIERYPASSCGNSFYDVKLGPQTAWLMIGRQHSGPFQTKLRFKLKGKVPVYSNEFEGSIESVWFKLPPHWATESLALRLIDDGQHQWDKLCARLQWPRDINFRQFIGTQITVPGEIVSQGRNLFVVNESKGFRVISRIHADEAERQRLTTKLPGQPTPAIYGTLRKFDAKTRTADIDAISPFEAADREITALEERRIETPTIRQAPQGSVH